MIPQRNSPETRDLGFKVIVVVLSRDDGDVLESSIRLNLQFCDAVVVAERNSNEGSREVLSRLQREGLPIVVFDDPRLDLDESDQVGRLCRNARRFFRPDWIFVLNADERIVCESRHVMERELRELESDHAAVLRFRDVPLEKHRRLLAGEEVRRWDELDADRNELPEARETTTLTELSLAKLASDRPRPFGRSDAHAAGKAASISVVGERRAFQAGTEVLEPESESGSLGAEFHQRSLYLDLPACRHLWERYRPTSVLDLGCGLGGYLEMFRRWGCEQVLGVDDFDEPEDFLAKNAYLRADLRSRLELGKKFDLVLCTEVLEHIDRRYELEALANIARHAGTAILFSAARPGQPGVGHINCQPPEYWLRHWLDLGWTADVFDSLATRSLSTFYWFRRNLLVLRPTEGDSQSKHRFVQSDLESYEARHAPWFGEAPAVYTFPLAVKLPRLEAGSASGDVP